MRICKGHRPISLTYEIGLRPCLEQTVREQFNTSIDAFGLIRSVQPMHNHSHRYKSVAHIQRATFELEVSNCTCLSLSSSLVK